MSFFEIDFQFLLLTIFNLQANILTTKDILSNLVCSMFLVVSCNKYRNIPRDAPINHGHLSPKGRRLKKLFSRSAIIRSFVTRDYDGAFRRGSPRQSRGLLRAHYAAPGDHLAQEGANFAPPA